MATVSVIIPVYKVAQFLERCIDSVVGQTFQDIEVILIDDGSPDQCGKICDNYAKRDMRIKVIHKKNEGLSAARNDGIKVATSDWLLFVDSDDYLDKNYIMQLYHPEAGTSDIVVGGANCEFATGVWEKRYGISGTDVITDKRMLNIVWANSMLCRYNPLGNGIDIDLIAYPWNKLYNRKLILEKAIFYNREYKVKEDVMFNLQYFKYVNRIFVSECYGYYYRYAPNGISSRYDPYRKQKDDFIFNKIKEFSREAENPYLKEFLDIYICLGFIANLKRYYFSRQNSKKLHEKLKIVKETLQEDMYREAFAKANKVAFRTYQYIAVYFARKQWTIGLALLTKLNVMRMKCKKLQISGWKFGDEKSRRKNSK